MRIWMLASLLIAVTATSGDRGMESSSRFFDREIASSSRFNPFSEVQQTERATASKCCKVCEKGKPCGDTCIEKDDECHLPTGCACPPST
jgi:hypothetical protein